MILTLADFVITVAHHTRWTHTHEGADKVLTGHPPRVTVVESLGTLIQIFGETEELELNY